MNLPLPTKARRFWPFPERCLLNEPKALIYSGSGSYIRLAADVCSYAILAGGLITILLCVHMVIVSYSSLPYFDGWNEINAVTAHRHPFSVHWLWGQNNEHRQVIPKLFLNIDLFFFHANQTFLLSSILAIQSLHWALLSWSMRALGAWHGSLWRSGTGLAALCLFCPSQQENFTWGFQVCFVLPMFLASVSFVGLLLDSRCQQLGKRGSGWFLALSILAALAATWSLASGNLLWPLLLGVALLLRMGRGTIVSLAVSGFLSTLTYFRHYGTPQQNANPLASLRAPLDLVHYVAVYFGSSWFRTTGFTASLVGATGLLLAFFVLLRTALHIRSTRLFSIQLAATIAFCMLTAFITAAGRLNSGVAQAAQSRYQTTALVFWCSLGLLVLQRLFLDRPRGFAFQAAQICILVVMMRGALLAYGPYEEARRHGFTLEIAAASLLSGVYEKGALERTFTDLNTVLNDSGYMQQHRLSIFAGDPVPFGKPIASAYRITSSDACEGAVDAMAPITDLGTHGVKVSGWAWDIKRGEPPLRVVATSNGIVTGVAAVGGKRPDIRVANPLITNDYAGFAGYVRDGQPSMSTNFYAVVHGEKEACLIATVN